MAALPSPTQVAGKNSAIYESYYSLVDPNGVGTVGALEAARFLKRSGLSDVVLSRIWDLSDPGARGCLDKAGFFVALKLVSVAQQGRDVNIENVLLDMAPPKMGDLPLPKPKKPPLPTNTPLITSIPPTSGVDWTIKPNEREKYDKLFDSLNPSNGLIPGNEVKGVLVDSKLPLETLGKIWELADQDKDGMLDRHEFVVAMHLVYKALEKHAIPNTLPPELLPPAKRKGSNTTGTPIMSRGLDGIKPVVPSPPNVPPPPNTTIPRPVMTTSPVVPPTSAPVGPSPVWVVTPDERAKYDQLFIKSDVDRDGYVSGAEIKNVFLLSGVPQAVLAHIWALSDIKQSGKLNSEQFALAMWLVGRCLKGIEPPLTLTPEMVPPSFRAIKPDGIVENNNTTYSNPELDMISKDIEELSKEKIALEADIQQKEADINIKHGEIKSLQVELDTLAATLKQLENQKGEAQKRLNDLKTQKSEVDKEMEEVLKATEEEKEKVDKLRAQATEQADAVASQEAELNSKKQQLESLKQDEQKLEQQKTENAKKLENLTSNLQETQFTISQVKAMITQLQEQTRQMHDAIAICDGAIESNDPNVVPDTSLKIAPEFRGNEYKKIGLTNGHAKQNGFHETTDPFSKQNGPLNVNSGFQDDPFKSDPFKNDDSGFDSSRDPFASNFSNKNGNGFQSDPFDSFNPSGDKTDPFSASGDKSKAETKTEKETDPFGCDPFAVLHAPTRDGGPPPPRPTSPSPALPPKKSKQPPPRPAPPRPVQPGKTPQSDPFGAPSVNDPFTSSNPSGFANFADFDSKFSDASSTTDFVNNNKKNVTSSTTTTNTATIKSLDFTDDPFRDYRYEDPFDIVFDDEPEDVINQNHHHPVGSLETLKSNTSNFDARMKNTPTPETQWKTDVNKNFDPFGLDSSFSAKKENITTTTTTTTASFDPFGLDSGRQSVPLPTATSLLTTTGRLDNSCGRASAPITAKLSFNEDQQLAWAASESLRLEQARKQREIQEEADLKLAIALSKAESRHGKK